MTRQWEQTQSDPEEDRVSCTLHSSYAFSSSASLDSNTPPPAYRDFAHVQPEDVPPNPLPSSSALKRRKGPKEPSFPTKLHDLLTECYKEKIECVFWQPHGRSFLIIDPQEFSSRIMPRYFRQTKYSSFLRQLSLYGFKRLEQGPDKASYYHERFLREKRFLSKTIKRPSSKALKRKANKSAQDEPNLHFFPYLPEVGTSGEGNSNRPTSGGGFPAWPEAPTSRSDLFSPESSDCSSQSDASSSMEVSPQNAPVPSQINAGPVPAPSSISAGPSSEMFLPDYMIEPDATLRSAQQLIEEIQWLSFPSAAVGSNSTTSEEGKTERVPSSVFPTLNEADQINLVMNALRSSAPFYDDSEMAVSDAFCCHCLSSGRCGDDDEQPCGPFCVRDLNLTN